MVLIKSLFSCTHNSKINNPSESYIKIYVDKDLPEEYKPLITRAGNDWERASNYKIRFDFIFNIKKPGLYKKVAHKYNQNYIWYFNKWDNEQLDLFDAMDKYNWKGFYANKKKKYIVIFDESSDKYNVILHELGHLLGLKHSINKNSAMSTNINDSSGCISFIDAQNLCDIYDCTAHNYCDIFVEEDEIYYQF